MEDWGEIYHLHQGRLHGQVDVEVGGVGLPLEDGRGVQPAHGGPRKKGSPVTRGSPLVRFRVASQTGRRPDLLLLAGFGLFRELGGRHHQHRHRQGPVGYFPDHPLGGGA